MELLPEKIEDFCRLAGFKLQGSRVLLAVSGGADSVAMLHFFVKAQNSLQLSELAVLHVDHALRKDSAEDLLFCESLAHSAELEFFSKRLDPATREKSESPEAWARHERYRMIGEVMACKKFDVCCTAHTLEDQAETILMRLERGTGLQGLMGIRTFVRISTGGVSAKILRPFLAIPRAELRALAPRAGLDYHEDPSNADTKILRNAWRKRIPELEKKEPELQKKAASMASRVQLLLPRLTLWTRDIFPECEDGGLNLGGICEHLAEGGWDDLLRIRIQDLLETHGLIFPGGRARWKEFLHFLSFSSAGAVFVLNEKWLFRRFRGRLTLEKTPGIFLEAELVLQQGENGVLELGEDLWFVDTRISVEQDKNSCAGGKSEKSDFSTFLPRAFCPEKLVFRSRRKGDLFGRMGRKKLKKVMNELGISPEKRDGLPLLTSGSRVLWIPGFLASPECRTNVEKREVVEVRCQKKIK